MTATAPIFRHARKAFVLGALSLLGLAPAAAQAAPSARFEHATKTVHGGQKVTVLVQAHEVDSCTLTAKGVKKTIALKGATKIRFRFTTAKSIKPGSYKLTLACGATTATRTLKVSKTKRTARAAGRTLVAGRITAKTLNPPATPASDNESGDPVGPNSPEVTQMWEKVKPTFTVRSGECTEWAFAKRMDIPERVERLRIAQWINAGRPGSVFSTYYWGGGHLWADYAKAAGFVVDSTPVVGAIYTVDFEDGTGHVGYVEEVFTDGSYRTSNMNAPEKGVVSYSVTPASVIAEQGIQFIH
jgi:surface antigen